MNPFNKNRGLLRDKVKIIQRNKLNTLRVSSSSAKKQFKDKSLIEESIADKTKSEELLDDKSLYLIKDKTEYTEKTKSKQSVDDKSQQLKEEQTVDTTEKTKSEELLDDKSLYLIKDKTEYTEKSKSKQSLDDKSQQLKEYNTEKTKSEELLDDKSLYVKEDQNEDNTEKTKNESQELLDDKSQQLKEDQTDDNTEKSESEELLDDINIDDDEQLIDTEIENAISEYDSDDIEEDNIVIDSVISNVNDEVVETSFIPEVSNNFDYLRTYYDENEEDIYIYNVSYKIVNTELYPYLMYYLYKYPKSQDKSSDLMTFPFTKIKKTSKNNELDNPILTKSKELNDEVLSDNNNHMGFIINNLAGKSNVFILYKSVDETNIEPIKKERKSNFWWCLGEELVNFKKVLNFPVSSVTSNLLLKNPSLLYLINNKTKEKYEVPSIGFHGTYYGLLPTIVSLGLNKSTLYPMMGRYYYFGTFRKAVRYAGWTSTYKSREIAGKKIADNQGLYEKGGIIRFAIFLGRMKAFLNHPDDDTDYSDRYYKRIKENPRDKKYQDLLLRLHDHEGKWSKEYDSVYLGRAKLDNGGMFMKNPEFIVKEYNQHNILTYHTLDKKTLAYDTRKGKYYWDASNENYNIC